MYQLENWKPSGVYNSKGLGAAGYQGKDYLRELVRRRDNHTCQICGRFWNFSERRRFDVHHLDDQHEGKSAERGSYAIDKNNLDRMVTLCHKCHLNLYSVRKKMSEGQKKAKKNLCKVIHS